MMTRAGDKFLQTTISPDAPSNMVHMWVGPRNRDEIEKALSGVPTLVAVPIGPNINDGTGTSYYARKKSFKSLAEYDTWFTYQQPKAPVLQCPYCLGDTIFTAESKTELQGHIQNCEGFKAQLPEAVKVVEESTFYCQVEGCDASFDSEKQLQGHMGGAHKGVGVNIKRVRREAADTTKAEA